MFCLSCFLGSLVYFPLHSKYKTVATVRCGIPMAPSACAALACAKLCQERTSSYWKGSQSHSRDNNEYLIIMTHFELDVKLGCRHQVANRYSFLALLAFDCCVCTRLIGMPASRIAFFENSGSESQLGFCSGFYSESSLHSFSRASL